MRRAGGDAFAWRVSIAPEVGQPFGTWPTSVVFPTWRHPQRPLENGAPRSAWQPAWRPGCFRRPQAEARRSAKRRRRPRVAPIRRRANFNQRTAYDVSGRHRSAKVFGGERGSMQLSAISLAAEFLGMPRCRAAGHHSLSRCPALAGRAAPTSCRRHGSLDQQVFWAYYRYCGWSTRVPRHGRATAHSRGTSRSQPSGNNARSASCLRPRSCTS